MAIYKFEELLKQHNVTPDQVTNYGSDASIQNSMSELESKKPNYFQRVGEGIKEGFQNAKEDINSNDGRSAFSKGLSAVSDVATAVVSPITEAPGIKQVGEVAGKVIQKGGDLLSNVYTPEFQAKLAEMSDEEYRKFTQPLEDLASTGNIANTILIAKGGQKGTQLAKEGVVKTGEVIKDAGSKVGTVVKNTVDKVTPDSQTIMNRVARLKPTDAQKFKDLSGKTHGEYLTETGNFKAPTEIVKNEAKKFTDTLNAKDATLAKFRGHFKDGALTDMLDGLIKKAETTSGENVKSPYLKQVTELKSKLEGKGLTMKDINLAKRLYEKEVKLGYNKLMNADAVKLATNIDSAVRKFQDTIAKKSGFKNLPELNKQIQISKFLVDKLGDQMVGQNGLNGVSLTDWVVLSGGNPTALAGFLTKKVLSSKGTQAKIAGYLNKNPIKETPTPKVTRSKPASRPQPKTQLGISSPKSTTQSLKVKDTINKQGGFIKNPLSKSNDRNSFGVKESSNTYRNIGGKKYEQWTDFANAFDDSGKYTPNLMGEAYDLKVAQKFINEMKKENPKDSFKAMKVYPDGFYRIYREVK